MNINSDIGEDAGSDELILRFIDSANVCCGTHAGSASTSIRTATRCTELKVEVGAHPGYDDRENFGRIEVGLSPAEIEDLVRFQVAALNSIAPIAYIKCHGWLYTRCQQDFDAALAVARVAASYRVGLVGQPGFCIIRAAEAAGLPAYREGYADRAYLPNGQLVPRNQPGAVLGPKEAADQGIRLALTGEFDTICLHGDSPGAALVAQALREAMLNAGIQTERLVART